ncbi:MAG: YhbY family RNA-binding protein [Coprobacillus sp.]|nr:YhbY family RNA-binding protein [Coprobacillus sp.]
MLSKKQKRYLKSEAQKLDIHYNVGKNEITDSLITMLDNALRAHELIKVDLNKSVVDETEVMAIKLSERLNAEVVDTRGRVIVLYRKNREKPIYKVEKYV